MLLTKPLTSQEQGKALWNAIFFGKAGDGRTSAVDSFNGWALSAGAGTFRLEEQGGNLVLTNGVRAFSKGQWDDFSKMLNAGA